jgi:methionyl-tRNA formyltransferase
MRVALLTTGGDYGHAVARELAERGVPLDAAVLDLHRPTLRTALSRPRRLLGPLRRRIGARGIAGGAPLHVVGDVNRPRSVRLLASLAPDVLVLAGARILAPEVLGVPTVGALNAHPAHLPGFRGTGVVGRAILAGTPVSVTVHFAAAEVDAGDVVERRLVPIVSGDTLESIQHRADRLCSETLASVVARAWRGEKLPREPQDRPGELSRWLTPAERQRAEALVASGHALRCYLGATARA